MKLIYLSVISSFLFLTSCGFKVANLQTNYSISEIQTSGDDKINFKIKNRLLYNSNNQTNSINLNIVTKKNKSIKEKSISNEISKYEINIITSVKYTSEEKDINGEFQFSKKGDYSVSDKYSDTLNNEKNLIKSLINAIIEEIEENLNSKFNDL